MKKMTKTLKQSLSILLAAVMVITSAPQTATSVLAAEADAIEADVLETADVVSDVKETSGEGGNVGKSEEPLNVDLDSFSDFADATLDGINGSTWSTTENNKYSTTYTGENIKPTITVTDPADLALGTDYEVQYKKADSPVTEFKDAGEYTVTIAAINEEGSKLKDKSVTSLSITFTINPYDFSSKATVEFSGKPGEAPTATVKIEELDNMVLDGQAEKDYSIAYTKDSGEYTAWTAKDEVTVTVTGKGNFAGSEYTTTYTVPEVQQPVPSQQAGEVDENTTITFSYPDAGVSDAKFYAITAKAGETEAAAGKTADEIAGNEGNNVTSTGVQITEAMTVYAVAVVNGQKSAVASFEYTVKTNGPTEANPFTLSVDFSELAKLTPTSYDDGYFSVESGFKWVNKSLTVNDGNKIGWEAGTKKSHDGYELGKSNTSSNANRLIVFEPTSSGKVTVGASTGTANRKVGYQIVSENGVEKDKKAELDGELAISDTNTLTEYTFTVEKGKKYAIANSDTIVIYYVYVEEDDYTPAPPVASLDEGAVDSGAQVTFAAPNNVNIYIKEGSEAPETTAQNKYDGNPITITEPKEFTLVAQAGKKTSAKKTFSYTIADPLTGTPVITFDENAKTVTLSVANADADTEIYYTLDGKDPVTSGTKYENGPLELTKTITVKAYAKKAGQRDSAVVTKTCIIKTSEKHVYVLDPNEEEEFDSSNSEDLAKLNGGVWAIGSDGYFKPMYSTSKKATIKPMSEMTTEKLGTTNAYKVEDMQANWPNSVLGTLSNDTKVFAITGGGIAIADDKVTNAVRIDVSAENGADVVVYYSGKTPAGGQNIVVQRVTADDDTAAGTNVTISTENNNNKTTNNTEVGTAEFTLAAGSYYIGFNNNGGLIPRIEVTENPNAESDDEPTSVDAPTLDPAPNASKEHEFETTPGKVRIIPATTGSKIKYVTDKDALDGGVEFATITAAQIYEKGTVYTEGTDISITETTTIKAMAYYDLKDGSNTLKSENFVECTYSIKSGAARTLDKPTATPASGAVEENSYVKLNLPTIPSDLSNAKIFYTTDGTDPATAVGGATKEYNTAGDGIQISAATTIKAIVATFGADDAVTGKSPVETFTYTIKNAVQDKVETPALYNAKGNQIGNEATIYQNNKVYLRTATEGATLSYSVTKPNSTTPDTGTAEGEKTFTLDAVGTWTFSATATKTNMLDSDALNISITVKEDTYVGGDDDNEYWEEDYREAMDTFGKVPEGLWIAGIDAEGYMYYGGKITPDVRVYNNETLLTVKTDYTIAYKNNVNVPKADAAASKLPTITVTGKGNYAGKDVKTFNIVPADISDDSDTSYGYLMYENVYLYASTKAQKPIPTLSYFMDPPHIAYEGTRKLKNKTDFTVKYFAADDTARATVLESVTAAGEYVIQVSGTGNYAGTKEIGLTLVDKANCTLVSKLSIKAANIAYSAEAAKTPAGIETTVTVKNGKTTLTKDEDYVLSFYDNHDSGTAKVTVTPANTEAGSKLIGSKTVTFKITGTAISKAKVTLKDGYKTYANNLDWDDAIDIKYNGTPLTGDDCSYWASDVVKGKITFTITGYGAFSGTVKKSFKVAALALDDGTETGSPFSYVYDDAVEYSKAGVKPDITIYYNEEELTAGTDYTVSYKNNKAVAAKDAAKAPAIVIKGKGNFKGTVNKNFAIDKKALSEVTFSIDDVAVNKNGKYAGKPVLTDNGTKLAAKKDYDKTLKYYLVDGETETPIENAAKFTSGAAGNVIKVVASAVENGAYTGEVSATYQIRENDFSKAKIKLAPGVKKDYTGEEVTLAPSDIVVTLGGSPVDYLIEDDVDETHKGGYEIVGYTNNIKKGTAKVTIRGTGNNAGSKTFSFKIQSKPMSWWKLPSATPTE